jgi:fused signal recognition particle receptor
LYHCGHTHTQTQTYQQIAGAPHETLLVVDASVGRNAVDQARTWKQEVGITGLAVTKLDGTARAGFVVSIARDLNVPVKLIGTCV